MMYLSREELQNQISIACRKSKRSIETVQLLTVSKLQSNEKIKEVYHQGQRHFAENYVQELTQKQDSINLQDLKWHLIGPLQKNKLNKIIGKCHRLHSIDNITTLQLLNEKAKHVASVENVLLQVNVANEQTKSGLVPEQLENLVQQAQSFQHIRMRGLMAMPPLQTNPEKNRPHFRLAQNLLQILQKRFANAHHTLDELSMGTSHDFQVAIEEGATWVRVGTLLFGER